MWVPIVLALADSLHQDGDLQPHCILNGHNTDCMQLPLHAMRAATVPAESSGSHMVCRSSETAATYNKTSSVLFSCIIVHDSQFRYRVSLIVLSSLNLNIAHGAQSCSWTIFSPVQCACIPRSILVVYDASLPSLRAQTRLLLNIFAPFPFIIIIWDPVDLCEDFAHRKKKNYIFITVSFWTMMAMKGRKKTHNMQRFGNCDAFVSERVSVHMWVRNAFMKRRIFICKMGKMHITYIVWSWFFRVCIKA